MKRGAGGIKGINNRAQIRADATRKPLGAKMLLAEGGPETLEKREREGEGPTSPLVEYVSSSGSSEGSHAATRESRQEILEKFT